MFEFTYDSLSPAQKDAYLERIGCAGLNGVSKENLDRLVYMHQCTVPFESLEVFYGKTDLPLDGQSLYRKVVERHRGGFCYELNGAFVMLLRALGYDAFSCVCRVAANRTDLGNLFHRACIVRMNGKMYLCDVGLGGPMAPFAVEVSEEHQTKHGETFWIEPTHEGWFLQKRLTSEGEEANVVIFAALPFLPNDFVPFCRALLSNPDSSFRSVRMVNLRTADGNINIRDNTLTITQNNNHSTQTFTDDEFPELLKKYFHMEP